MNGRVSTLTDVPVAPLEELPPGTMKLVDHEPYRVGVYNCEGELRATEDRQPMTTGRSAPASGRRGVHGRAPAPRRELRPRDRPGPLTSGLPACTTFPRRVDDGVVVVRLTEGCWETTDEGTTATTTRSGAAGAGRRGVYERLPGGLSRDCLADDPAQAPGVSRARSRASTRIASRAFGEPDVDGCRRRRHRPPSREDRVAIERAGHRRFVAGSRCRLFWRHAPAFRHAPASRRTGRRRRPSRSPRQPARAAAPPSAHHGVRGHAACGVVTTI